MRDIRADLKERLEENERERSRIAARLKELDFATAALMNLLDLEDKRIGDLFPENREKLTLLEFVLSELSDGQERSKDELRESAKKNNYSAEGGSLGRAIHATIMNLVRSGRIEEVNDRYRSRMSEEDQSVT